MLQVLSTTFDKPQHHQRLEFNNVKFCCSLTGRETYAADWSAECEAF